MLLLYVVSLKLMVLLKKTVSLNAVVVLKNSNAVSFVSMGHRTHFWRRFPMKSWRPTRAKTARAKTVRIMTSTIFFTDWIKAATMVFKPDKVQFICCWYISQNQTALQQQMIICWVQLHYYSYHKTKCHCNIRKLLIYSVTQKIKNI